jgi:hypothetical protein
MRADCCQGCRQEESETMKPRVSILSIDFKYVPAVSTDVARTFARIRREQREWAEQRRQADVADAPLSRIAAANDAATGWRHYRSF